MAKELFIKKNFTTAHLYTIRQANEIISEYMKAGFTLTLRQLYYQFVARDLLENKQTEYKRLGGIIDEARKAGLIDWDAIEDRTRNLRGLNTWNDPQSIIKGSEDSYRLDPWKEQKVHVEVWIEKDALVGVVESVCNRYRVDYFACRGYTSQSEAYGAGKRLASYADAGYRVVVLHLGDHDPSGMQMTDDNRKRLSLFAGRQIDLRRIALNMDQIDEFGPPPNWAKEDDSRTKWYVEEFGTNKSWELDALDPKVIDGLIESHVKPLIDEDKWKATMQREDTDRAILRGVRKNWPFVAGKPWLLKTAEEMRAEAVELVRDYMPEESDSVETTLQYASEAVGAIKLERGE